MIELKYLEIRDKYTCLLKQDRLWSNAESNNENINIVKGKIAENVVFSKYYLNYYVWLDIVYKNRIVKKYPDTQDARLVLKLSLLSLYTSDGK